MFVLNAVEEGCILGVPRSISAFDCVENGYEKTNKLLFLARALAISSKFMAPISPRASTSSICLLITW